MPTSLYKMLVRTILVTFPKIFARVKMLLLRSQFKQVGANVIFRPEDRFSFATISIGSNVFIGAGATFSASESEIVIQDKVMFGPNVTIMGGDHRSDVVGAYMFDVKEKVSENDLPVLIETDVWIGANATILKGVTVGRGAIVAAGSVVIDDVAPYSIVAGVPARQVSERFVASDIERHEQMLGIG